MTVVGDDFIEGDPKYGGFGMEYAGDQPSAADYASAAARSASDHAIRLEERVKRIEDVLGLPHFIPEPDPIEEAKRRDAEANGRKYAEKLGKPDPINFMNRGG